jgi:hypothetical protein
MEKTAGEFYIFTGVYVEKAYIEVVLIHHPWLL